MWNEQRTGPRDQRTTAETTRAVDPAEGKVKIDFCDFIEDKDYFVKRTLYQFGKELCIILNK